MGQGQKTTEGTVARIDVQRRKSRPSQKQTGQDTQVRRGECHRPRVPAIRKRQREAESGEVPMPQGVHTELSAVTRINPHS